MGSSAATVAFIVDQLGAAVTAKAMFGEYGIYRQGVLIGLVCDDHLFLKPSQAARALLGHVVEAPPYPGAKPSFVVPADRWDDADLMVALATATSAAVSARPRKSPPKVRAAPPKRRAAVSAKRASAPAKRGRGR